MMAQADPPLELKDLINFLFQQVQHPAHREYTVMEVIQQANISPGTIGQLRTGRIKSPTLSTLKALGQFFGVPLNFFECTSYDECFAVLAGEYSGRSMEAAEIAFRAARLSPRSQQDLLRIITWVEAAERERQAGRELPPLSDLSQP